MGKNKSIFICLLLVFLYFIVTHFIPIYIPCPIHYIFHIYCPGCGVTRMIKSMIELDFVSAFHYNQVLFISSPIIIFLIINYIYCNFKGKRPLVYKIPNYIYYIYLVILFIFMIYRNIFLNI